MLKLAEDHQPSQPRNQLQKVTVQALFPKCTDKRRIDPHRGGDRRFMRSMPMQTQKSGTQPDDAQHPFKRLHQGLLDLAAHEARRGEVQAGKRENIELDPSLLILIQHHDHCHGSQ